MVEAPIQHLPCLDVYGISGATFDIPTTYLVSEKVSEVLELGNEGRQGLQKCR
jgi:hypothetical protein